MTSVVERRWTDAQQRAIATRARTLVAAAAGSGKTSVLTELIVQALCAGEVAPAEVCAVTFTEKAAQEMRGRIAHRLSELGEHDLLGSLELARIGTIHSLCAWILRHHGAAVGINPNVQLLDEAQGAWLERTAMRRALREHADDADVYLLRSRMGDDAIIEVLRDVHRIAMQGDGSARLVDPRDAQPIVDPKQGSVLLTGDEASSLQRAWVTIWQSVTERIAGGKQQLGRIAFDDLERLALEAARREEIGASLRARWSLLLVDEFQDTNARQYELLDLIGGSRLFMVGDEWQSIYRFRGADIDVFRSRRQEAGSSLVPMRENFRSDAPVLDVVNRVFGHDEVFGSGYEPVLAGTEAQQVVEGTAVELLVVPESDLPDLQPGRGTTAREREAWRVAERVAELVASGEAQPGEIAVLYARRTGVELYEQALRAWGLPVLRAASDGLYDQRDVRDALAVLGLLRNSSDDHAALTVLAGPLGSLEWWQLEELVRTARTDSIDLLVAAGRSSFDGARRVASYIDELAAIARSASLVEIVARVVSLPELELGAALDRSGLVRLANLRRLIELAASAAEVDVRDVAGLLEFIDAQRRDARIGEASIADEQMGAVRMLTVHAAKGLEFPHVFVVEAAAAGNGRPRKAPAPLLDSHGFVQVALPTVTGSQLMSPAHETCKDIEQAAQLEETRRLWYVAMTRARRRLFISGHWEFEPTKKGTPRALAGALKWLAPALDLAPDLGGAGRTYRTLDGLVRVDTRVATQDPQDIWQQQEVDVTVATPLPLAPGAVPQPDGATVPEAETTPEQLQARLHAAVLAGPDEEWRQLEGTRVHDAVARLLDHARNGTPVTALLDPSTGPWLTDRVRQRLEPVVASEVFALLARHGARTEVPFVSGSGEVIASRAAPGVQVAARSSDVDSGRFDALVRGQDDSWWIVDWKSTLPPAAADAWKEHAVQLRRYAAVAIAGGARSVRLTLVPLDRPDDPHTWLLDPTWFESSSERAEPPRSQLPD